MITTIIVIVFLGCLTGFMAGFLGLGGGVILAPILILFSQLNFEHSLSLTEITGITAAQGFISSLSSWYFHRKISDHSSLGWTIGIPMGLGALITASLATHWNDAVILCVFSAMLMASISFNFINRKSELMNLNKMALAMIALLIGSLNGIIGQGGAFFFIPFFAYFLGIPLKMVIASAGLIGFLSVSSALVPRVLHGNIPWIWVLSITPAIIIASRFGTSLSIKMNELLLRRSILAVLTISFIQLVYRVQAQVL